MAPDWRAARKWGSSGTESSDTNAYTALRTLPAAHSSPRSGPPWVTIVRSRRSLRAMARTSDIGLRRLAQPPMAMVMPDASRATTSSSVISLSAMSAGRVGVAALDEGVPVLVGHPRQVELEGEALLEAV